MPASNRGKTRTRISLLAGSSLAAATIILSAGGVALMPTAALAANECAPVGVDPSVNGPASDTYACAGANAYATTGVTYSSAGDLTVNSTGAMSVGTVGVNLTANTTDAVTFTATGLITGTAGPVIDVTSVSGPISITSAGVTGTNVNVTHGIQAVSTGGGAVSVTNTAGNVNVNSNTAGPLQQTAIRAISTGGNGAVSVTTAGNVTGRLRGIEAQASGMGALTITATGGVAVNTGAGVGVAAIDARTGTGLLTINIDTGSGTINGSSGSAILTNAGGDAVINIATGRQVSASVATAAALNLTAVGSTTIANAGTISATAPGVAIKASGGGFALTSTGTLTGRLDLSGVTGASTVTSSGTWSTSGDSHLGAGASTLTNSGTLTVGTQLTASTFIFSSLETFNNSGTINLRDNTLSAAGADFTGSGASTLLITTTLDPAGSTACGLNGSGCLDLTGGTTAGMTSIVLTATAPLAISYNPGIVLVDASGGTSVAGHFVLDPTSTGYTLDPVLGAVLATEGLFAYSLGYDADTQQHVLASVPGRDAFEFTPVIHEALSTWHTTSDMVAGRQADLGAGANGGAWIRMAAEHSDRELSQSFTSGGNTFAFDNGYALETGAAIAGFDLLRGDDITLGVHGGYVQSKLSFEGSDTRDKLSGPTVGVYGGWRAGPLSLDGAFNANMLELERTSLSFEDLVTNVITLGGRAEAAWKIGGPFYIQPLVAAAYVKSTVEDVAPTGYDIAFEDAASSRAAVGLRAGADMGTLGAWAVARAWKEFSGDGAVSINNTSTTTGVTFADDLSGDFQELGAGLSVANDGDTLRGFISVGAKLADDIDNYSFSLGARLRW